MGTQVRGRENERNVWEDRESWPESHREKERDENDKLCLSMLNESIVKYKDGDIESYLFHIFDQPKQSAFRIP